MTTAHFTGRVCVCSLGGVLGGGCFLDSHYVVVDEDPPLLRGPMEEGWGRVGWGGVGGLPA